MGLAVGIRREWSVGATSALFNVVVCNGLATKELTVLNTGNNTLASLEAGKGSLNGANSTMANLWTSANLVKAYAQQLIDNSSVIGDPGTKAGVEAYGLFFKALAIGTLCQFWEQAPTEVISSNDYIGGLRPSFKPRAAALDEAIAILKQAEAGAPVPELCREHGISTATFYKWRSKFGGMDASLMARLKELEDENRRLKKMYAEERLKAEIIAEAMAKKW